MPRPSGSPAPGAGASIRSTPTGTRADIRSSIGPKISVSCAPGLGEPPAPGRCGYVRAHPFLAETGHLLARDNANFYYLLGVGRPAAPIPWLKGQEIGNYFVSSDKAHLWLAARPLTSPQVGPFTVARLDMEGRLESYGPPLGVGNFNPLTAGGEGTASVTRSDVPGLLHFRAGAAGEFDSTREAQVNFKSNSPGLAEAWFGDQTGGWYLFRGDQELLEGRALFKEGGAASALVAKTEGGTSGWGWTSERRTNARRADSAIFTLLHHGRRGGGRGGPEIRRRGARFEDAQAPGPADVAARRGQGGRGRPGLARAGGGGSMEGQGRPHDL